jgi:hypothetical protein
MEPKEAIEMLQRLISNTVKIVRSNKLATPKSYVKEERVVVTQLLTILLGRDPTVAEVDEVRNW